MKRSSLFSLLIAIVLLCVWELACRAFNVPDFILPTPSQILKASVFQAAILLPNAGTTALEILIGILISLMVSVPLSIAMFAHSSIENALAPFLVASQAVPVFAIAVAMLIGFEPTIQQLLGGAIVLAGVLSMQWRKFRP